MPQRDPADLAHLAALAREALENTGALEALAQAEGRFRAAVRQSETLTMAAADEGTAATFGAVVTELLDGDLARRPR